VHHRAHGAVENYVKFTMLSDADAPDSLELTVEDIMGSKSSGVQLACTNMLSSLVAQNGLAILKMQPDAPGDATHAESWACRRWACKRARSRHGRGRTAHGFGGVFSNRPA
jgi:hypothetical protein